MLIVAVGLAVIAALLLAPRFSAWRRERARARPFPEAWRAVLRRNVAAYRGLPRPQRQRLEGLVNVFLAEKRFIGCAGQAVDDEVRLTVAAQACLLLLGRERGVFPKLHNVLVYPGAFAVERLRAEPSGILQEHRQVLTGESWSHGQVVLSWDDALAGGMVGDDGRNVVIHEFAHQLDQEKGYANGAPRGAVTRKWAEILSREYAALQQRAAMGEPTLLDPYGATAPQEFFAVASEVFFEQPAALATHHPELYAELSRYYALDPRAW